MSYTSLSKKRSSIRSKLKSARDELSSLKSKKDDLFESLEAVEDKKITESAKVKVNKGSNKAAKKAQKEYDKVKSQLDSVRDDIQVQEKAISMLEQDKADIESKFQQAAREKWHKKADKHLSNIHDLMEKLQSEIDKLHGYQKEMQKDGFHTPSRQFFKGITRKSQPVISKGKLGADIRNFITANNLKQD